MFIKRATICLAALAALLASVSSRAQGDVVTINGHKAYADSVIVKVKKPEGGLRALSLPGADSIKSFDAIPGLLGLKRDAGLRAANAQSEEEKSAALKAWIEELQATGQFEYVEPNYQKRGAATPSDRRFQDGTLWGLHNYGQFGGTAGVDIQVTNAWDLTVGATNILVAIIDTGVRYTHQDLAPQMWTNPGEIPGNGVDDDNDGYVDNVYGIDAFNNDGDPMDDNGHGTHIAGTIGAVANDSNEHVGVAWRVRMMALKFLNSANVGDTLGEIECINFAIRRGVRIINASYAGGALLQSELDAILAARAAGILIIAAAGNESNDNDIFPSYPASMDVDNIISVAAMDRFERLASFSNYGRESVDIAAPGVEIWSTWITSDTAYGELQGTSMATPHVVGVAVLTWAFSPAAGYSEIRNRILASAVPVPSFAPRLVTGGRVSAFRALTGGADGIIEMSVVPASGSFLTVGSTVEIRATLSDGVPITNATVQANTQFGGGTNLTFRYTPPGTNGVTIDGTYLATYRVPDEPGVIDFTFNVGAPSKTNLVETVTYNAVERPVNDLFVNAIKVPANGGRFEQSMDFASREDQFGEPLHGDTQGTVGGSVWYSWSLPPMNGVTSIPVLIDTAGTPADTIIAVYTGSDVSRDQLQLVAVANDIGDLRQAWLKFVAEAGISYKIAIATAEQVDRPGTLKVRFEINGEPDTIRPFVSITSPFSGTISRTNRVMISGNAFDPVPNASGVAEVQISVNGSPGVRAQGTTNWVSPFPMLLDPGLNIIRVVAFDDARNQSAPVQINVTLQEDVSASDLFARASELTAGPSPRVVSSTAATKEFGEPMHAGNRGGKSVWFYYRPTQDGVLFLSAAGSSFDTLLGVYRGTNVANLTEIVSNDDTPAGSKQSEVTLGVRAGEIYNIAVDGYDGASGEVVLNYALTPGRVFNISALPAVGGRVSPSNRYFPENSAVSIVATPEQGFEFAQFVVQGSGEVITENPLTIRVTNDVVVLPVFRAQQFVEDFEGAIFKLPFVARNWQLGPHPDGGAGNVALSQETAASRNVTNTLTLLARTLPGIGSFDFGVSSETNYDRLEFWVTYYTDNTPGQPILLGRWSGEMRSRFQFETRAGLMQLEWRYTKDAAISLGRDMAFIDNLDLDYDSVVRPPVTVGAEGDSLRVTASGVPGSTLVIEASPDLKTWVALPPVTVGADGTASVLQPIRAGRQFFRVK